MPPEKVDVSATSAVNDKAASVSVVERLVLSNKTTAFFPWLKVGFILLPLYSFYYQT